MGFPQKDPAGRKIPTRVHHPPNYQVPTPSLNPKPLHLQQYSSPAIAQSLQPLVPNLQPYHHLPQPPNMVPHYTTPPPANLQHPPPPIPVPYTFHVGNNYSQHHVPSTPMDISQVPVDSQKKAKKSDAIDEFLDELNGKKPQAKLCSKGESSSTRSKPRRTSREAGRKEGTSKERLRSSTPEQSRKSRRRSPFRNRSPSPDRRKTQEKSRSPRRSQSSGRRKRPRSKTSHSEVCIESSAKGRRSRTPDSRRIKRSSRSRSRSPKRYKTIEEPRREMNRLKREERVREFFEEEGKMRTKLRMKRDNNGKVRKGSPRNRKPPSPIKVTKNDVTVLRTIRQISAWENYLDDINPITNDYLNKAIRMERKKIESSEDLVNEADFCRMLDASLEKLKFRMGTGVIVESQEKRNCRNCMNSIAILLQRSTCEKQEILEIGVSKINSAKESGHKIKRDITEQVFKRHSQQLREKDLNLIVEKVYSKLKHQNPAPTKKSDDDDEVVKLLYNFKELEQSEQERLLAYTKKLENNYPEKARRLKSSLSSYETAIKSFKKEISAYVRTSLENYCHGPNRKISGDKELKKLTLYITEKIVKEEVNVFEKSGCPLQNALTQLKMTDPTKNQINIYLNSVIKWKTSSSKTEQS